MTDPHTDNLMSLVNTRVVEEARLQLHGEGLPPMDRVGRRDRCLAAKLAASIGQPVPTTDFVFEQTEHA